MSPLYSTAEKPPLYRSCPLLASRPRSRVALRCCSAARIPSTFAQHHHSHHQPEERAPAYTGVAFPDSSASARPASSRWSRPSFLPLSADFKMLAEAAAIDSAEMNFGDGRCPTRGASSPRAPCAVAGVPRGGCSLACCEAARGAAAAVSSGIRAATLVRKRCMKPATSVPAMSSANSASSRLKMSSGAS